MWVVGKSGQIMNLRDSLARSLVRDGVAEFVDEPEPVRPAPAKRAAKKAVKKAATPQSTVEESGPDSVDDE